MLNVGIIGLGVGEAHIEGYTRHSACRVTTLCDCSEEKLRLAREKYPGIRVTRDARALLTDPDIHVVSIASYDDVHAEQILLALETEKHVFAEKPLCLLPEEARRIRASLRSHTGTHLSSNLILRRVPRLVRLKELKARLGRIYLVEGDYNYGRIHKITEGWRGTINHYSVILGGAIHLIDLLLWLTEDRIIEVSAFGTKIATQGTPFRYNDSVAAILRFDGGAIGKMSANFACVMPHTHLLSLYGTEGSYLQSPQGAYLYTSRESMKLPEQLEEPYSVAKGELIPEFIESIVQGAPSPVTVDEIFAALSVGFAIDQSADEGKTVAVQYL